MPDVRSKRSTSKYFLIDETPVTINNHECANLIIETVCQLASLKIKNESWNRTSENKKN